MIFRIAVVYFLTLRCKIVAFCSAKAAPHTQFALRRVTCAVLISLTGWLNSVPFAAAQTPPQPPLPASNAPQKTQSESEQSSSLLDGLLDLLTEPAPTETPQGTVQSPAISPVDVGLDGEDLGKAGEHPLEAVRQSMLIAAGFLRRGSTTKDTMKLQSDIVQRLDDLIHELESSQGSPNQSAADEQPGQLDTQVRQQQQGEKRNQSTSKASKPEAKEPENPDQPGTATGEPQNLADQQPGIRSVHAQLNDPRALQQSVWGQLPERVRQQMQSRMVEQFLPAYREQIEAYFQALLK